MTTNEIFYNSLKKDKQMLNMKVLNNCKGIRADYDTYNNLVCDMNMIELTYFSHKVKPLEYSMGTDIYAFSPEIGAAVSDLIKISRKRIFEYQGISIVAITDEVMDKLLSRFFDRINPDMFMMYKRMINENRIIMTKALVGKEYVMPNIDSYYIALSDKKNRFLRMLEIVRLVFNVYAKMLVKKNKGDFLNYSESLYSDAIGIYGEYSFLLYLKNYENFANDIIINNYLCYLTEQLQLDIIRTSYLMDYMMDAEFDDTLEKFFITPRKEFIPKDYLVVHYASVKNALATYMVFSDLKMEYDGVHPDQIIKENANYLQELFKGDMENLLTDPKPFDIFLKRLKKQKY